MTEERHPIPGEVWRRIDYPKLTCRIGSVDDEKVTVTILTNDMGNPHLAPTNRSMNPDGLMFDWSGPMMPVTEMMSLHARELGGTCLPGFLDRWVRARPPTRTSTAAPMPEVERMSDEPTFFGQSVGDGLDREREDARLAISILRKVMAEGLLWRNGRRLSDGESYWVELSEAEARLLEELSE